MRRKTLVRLGWGVGALSAAILIGCRDNPLGVKNTQQPSVEGVFSSPLTVETAVSKLFEQLYNGQMGNADDLFTQTITMSFESASQLGNFGMGTRGAIPRAPIDNSIGNNVSAGNFRDFDFLSRNARLAASAVAALDKFIAGNSGTPALGTVGRDARAKAFGYFALGYAMANLAMFYDSAAIMTPQDAIDPATGNYAVPSLSISTAVMDAAIKDLDSAIAIVAAGPSANVPADWLAQNSDMTPANFTRLLRSYRAKFRAGLGRNPTQRAAADWNAIIADATNGITSDFVLQISQTVTGWSGAVQQQLATSTGWSQMTPFIVGMADTTGAYDTWLQQALTARTPFLIRTPDKRFPSGDTRALQQATVPSPTLFANPGGTSKAGTPTGSIVYFRNRPTGEDSPADPWGTSFYDNQRNFAIRANGGNGTYVFFAVAENDMLAAEGYLRTGNVAAAIPLINKTRTRANLPAIPVTAILTDVVPGGNACVPRVPQPPAYNTTACGTIFEAMKWEKRIETNMIGYAQWFIDSRGWGDLVVGTPLEWPVPYQELFARGKASYTTSARAATSSYGW